MKFIHYSLYNLNINPFVVNLDLHLRLRESMEFHALKIYQTVIILLITLCTFEPIISHITTCILIIYRSNNLIQV